MAGGKARGKAREATHGGAVKISTDRRGPEAGWMWCVPIQAELAELAQSRRRLASGDGDGEQKVSAGAPQSLSFVLPVHTQEHRVQSVGAV